jgi:hypothetical protein
LLYLLRHRNHLLPLDHTRLLTRGSPVGFSALLGPFSLSDGTYTAVSVQDSPRLNLIGQALYNSGERAARLEFVLPASATDSPALLGLLDELAKQTGALGADSILAEANPNDPVFEALRRCGFSVFTWQHIWQLPAAGARDKDAQRWESAQSQDEFAARSLFAALVPPLAQSAEPVNPGRIRYVYRQHGNLLAYAAVTAGPLGVYIQPLIHPDVEELPALMADLLECMPSSRPLYLALRSYQAFLSPALEQLGGKPSERQALLVKHLTSAQRAAMPAVRRTVLEQRGEPSAPIVNHAVRRD